MYKFLILISVLLASCGGADTQHCTVELNGDSIMSGLQIKTFATSIKQLRPEFIITDKAVSGLTLRSLANGYITAYPGATISNFGPQPAFSKVARNSHVILIELGGNDAYSDYSPIEFRQQLEAMIIIILSEGRIPVLTGIVPLSFVGGTFDQATIDRATVLDSIVHELAIKYDIVDAQWRTVPYFGSSDTIDGIHRTQVAADRLVERTVSALDTACNR